MAFTARTTLGRRLGVLITGAVALTTLLAGTGQAVTPAPMRGQTVGLMGLDASDPGSGLGAGLRARTGASTSPRTPVPGFLLERGRVTRFDAPKAGLETAPNSINNRGQIVGAGVEADADATYHGFLRDARGRFTTIDLPGARATAPSRINDRGQIVGRYYQTTPFQGPDARSRGFLLDHGKLTRIDVPGAAQTQAVGINNLGQVVGEYQNPDGTYHGFLWHKGRYATIDWPGAAATSLIDINDRGQILGSYADDLTQRPGTFHGLLVDRGRFISFDVPGVTFTLPRDINNRGQIAGSTLDDLVTLAGARGFVLAKGVKGPLTPIDVPGAPRNLVRGLNDRNQLVGSYENINATPSPQPTGTPPMARRS
jgi:probable HAF family extracellular repeat protein